MTDKALSLARLCSKKKKLHDGCSMWHFLKKNIPEMRVQEHEGWVAILFHHRASRRPLLLTFDVGLVGLGVVVCCFLLR